MFYYDDEKALDPLLHLNIPLNTYTGDDEYLELGKKLSIDYFENQEDGYFIIVTKNFFSIIEICNREVKYKLNRQEKF